MLVSHILSTYALIMLCVIYGMLQYISAEYNSRCSILGGLGELLVVSKYSHFGLNFQFYFLFCATFVFLLPEERTGTLEAGIRVRGGVLIFVEGSEGLFVVGLTGEDNAPWLEE